jgi:hypothetical protein
MTDVKQCKEIINTYNEADREEDFEFEVHRYTISLK